MAELPNLSSLTQRQLESLRDSPTFPNLPEVYRNQVLSILRSRTLAQQARPGMGQVPADLEREVSEAEHDAAMQRMRADIRQRNIAEQAQAAVTPPAENRPPADMRPTATPEDLMSEAIRTVVPPPVAPAPPAPPAPPAEERPARAAPTPAPVAAGGGGAPRVAPGEGAESRRARASGETADILKTLAEPERKPNIMDSPYTALINAGLNILMGGAGKSPLEAIATGGGAALKTLGEQAAREEARGEKRLDRAYRRAELGTKIRSEIQGLEQKEEQLRLELEKIISQRANYASEAAHRAAILKVQERLADATEKRAEATDRLATVRETSMGIPGLQQNIRDLNARITARQRDRNQALQASERQRIDDEIDAARAELRGYMEEWSRITGGRMPAAPAAPTLPTQRVR
jgi:hypothetical protein